MTNYDDIYMKKDNHIIQLRIVFGYYGDMDVTESEYNGKIFVNTHNIDNLSARHTELTNKGYKEVHMYQSYTYDMMGHKTINYNFED